MLTVAEVASARLTQLLDDQGLPEDVAVRFVFEGQGIALKQDSERPGDTTFQQATEPSCCWMTRCRSRSLKTRSMSRVRSLRWSTRRKASSVGDDA